MNLEQYVAGATAIIGFVNLADFAFKGNWQSFTKGVIGLVVGGVIGFFKMYGVPSLEIGILLGFSASGVYKLLQVVKPQIGQPNV